MGPELRKSHIELNQETSVVARWVSGVAEEVKDWTQPDVMKTMKVKI